MTVIKTPGSNSSLGLHAVDPESVGQYTGLASLGGEKIFEGDLVRRIFYYPLTDDPTLYIVAWSEELGAWGLRPYDEYSAEEDDRVVQPGKYENLKIISSSYERRLTCGREA